jgi:hypothetical protein
MRVGGNQVSRSQVSPASGALGGGTIGQFRNSRGLELGALETRNAQELRNCCTAKRLGNHIEMYLLLDIIPIEENFRNYIPTVQDIINMIQADQSELRGGNMLS